VAHQVVERFPDGQLYVNLRGYDPDEPVSAADALAGFLRALGVPSTDIPEETEERARLYRSTMAARHFLVLLDNARDSEQVRPLLPGDSGCVALVTSRDALAGLVARDGARRLALDLLPLLDAVELLRTLIGDRVSADPEAAGILATQCARLPLALRVAAELAVARPAMPLGELARELAERSGRLDLLDAGGDVRTAVRAVFWSSYRHLDSADARLFRLAGLHPGPDFSIHAAAALAGRDLPAVDHALERLTRAHLVHRVPGRYGLHDLLHEYARELAAQDDAEHNRAATGRVLDYYLNGATAATDIIFPAGPRSPGPVAAPPGIPPMADATAARSWLNGEMACLVRVTGFAADSGWHSHATRLALVLFRHLEVSGRYAEGEIIFCHALRAATMAGDRDAEADALTNMGLVDLRRGGNQRASIRLQDALEIYRALGDRRGMSRVLNNLGIVALQQGRYDEAAAHIGESIDHYQAAGDRDREARATYNLGFVRLQQCRYDEAARHLTDALRLHEKNGTLPGVARALRSLGAVELRQGDVDQACSRLQEALRLSREIGDRAGEPYVLADLGLAALKQEQHERAVARYEQALAMLSELGDRPGQAAALNGLGEALRASGDPSGGRTHHFRALSMATEIGEKSEQARARDGLGHCYLAEGQAESARQHWREALRLYSATGVPTAEIVRVQLASLDPNRPPSPKQT
jgi:tetratricopeptide (TPR) repeat protein